MFRFRAVAVVLLVMGLGASAVALAAGDDRGVAETALREVAASPKKDVARELVAKSQASLARGTQLRTKGDESHARIADTAARAWAEAARDSVKAAAVEETAAKARVDADDAGLLAERERALLEEAVAQSGRLRGQLEGAPGSKEGPARTSTAANSDAGAKPPAKPKAAKGLPGALAPTGPTGLDGGAP